MIIGMEKGQNIIELMDTGEIKAVLSQLRSLTVLSPGIREVVWAEFKDLGYEETMKPYEILNVMRFLFNGSKISG